jgi:hypothetical protein
MALKKIAQKPARRTMARKTPAKAAETTTHDELRDKIHDALNHLADARRFHANKMVQEFRNQPDLAKFEEVCFHEAVEVIFNHLTWMDINLEAQS